MLLWYVGGYIPRRNDNDFESARENLMKKDDKVVEKRRFERICKKMHFTFYTVSDKIHESKEIFI